MMAEFQGYLKAYEAKSTYKPGFERYAAKCK
jgi:hypothetical protein